MSIFNENGNYINLKDPLERMPYVMQEINMICNNYDYITEGINLNDIKNAIKKAWLKFKTFITDALRSIKIKINDNTNKLLRYIEKNKTKVDEILKDKDFGSYDTTNVQVLLQTYNKLDLDIIKKDNEDKSNTELLAIIRGKLTNRDDEPLSAENFTKKFIDFNQDRFMRIPNSSSLIKFIKDYQAMIKSIDTVIKKTEQDKILQTLNKDPNLDFTNGLISIYNTLLSYIIKRINNGIKEIISTFKGKNSSNLYDDDEEEEIKYNSIEDEQIAAIKNNVYSFKDIENPSEKVQLAAINKDPDMIKNINNPSEKVQLAAVNRNGHCIVFIKDPSEKVQLAAINSKFVNVIMQIKDPSEKVQLAAINKDPYDKRYIKNPTEKVKQLYKEKTGKDWDEENS